MVSRRLAHGEWMPMPRRWSSLGLALALSGSVGAMGCGHFVEREDGGPGAAGGGESHGDAPTLSPAEYVIDAAGRSVELGVPPCRIAVVGHGSFMALHLLAMYPGGRLHLVALEQRGPTIREAAPRRPRPACLGALSPPARRVRLREGRTPLPTRSSRWPPSPETLSTPSFCLCS